MFELEFGRWVCGHLHDNPHLPETLLELILEESAVCVRAAVVTGHSQDGLALLGIVTDTVTIGNHCSKTQDEVKLGHRDLRSV